MKEFESIQLNFLKWESDFLLPIQMSSNELIYKKYFVTNIVSDGSFPIRHLKFYSKLLLTTRFRRTLYFRWSDLTTINFGFNYNNLHFFPFSKFEIKQKFKFLNRLKTFNFKNTTTQYGSRRFTAMQIEHSFRIIWPGGFAGPR